MNLETLLIHITIGLLFGLMYYMITFVKHDSSNFDNHGIIIVLHHLL